MPQTNRALRSWSFVTSKVWMVLMTLTFEILATAIISIISSFYHEAMQFAIKKYHCNANRK